MAIRRFALALLVAAASLPATAQMLKWESPSPYALEEFRLGIQSFQRGYFNESILSLEKALAASPDDPLILSWLARSYYRSGLDLTAAEQWQRILDSGIVSPYVSGRIEFLKASRTLEGTRADRETLIESGSIPNMAGKLRTFLRPSWISPAADGSFWLTAFGSDELLRFDVNGVILARLKGPIGGLDRPFCAIPREGGGFFVSEYGLDSIAVLAADGSLVKRFGGKGRGDGKLLGPQYLCRDVDGYLYVSDYGNRRIAKFDPEGQFVLSFGTAAYGFPGLSEPTGVASLDGQVFVADARSKAVFAFDRDGNYKRTLAFGALEKPEGIAAYGADSLIVADSGRILALDVRTEEMTILYTGQERRNRLLCAVPDANGNVIACDFDLSRIAILSAASSVYSGFDVNVLRVNADRFPSVDAEVLVRDNRGNPISGLVQRNFYVTEQIPKIEQRIEGTRSVPYETYSAQAVPSLEILETAGQQSSLDSIILFDPTALLRAEARSASDPLVSAMEAIGDRGSLSSVYAGKAPSYEGPAEPAVLFKKFLGQATQEGFRLDLGLRLAASKLATSPNRRAVFYVTSGFIGEESFRGYSLSESAAFLANNGISFFVLILGRGKADPALEYLAARSDGQTISLGRPKGIADIVDSLATAPSGRYVLRFMSQADSDFGKAYLPFAVEAYLMKKSGRDECGFFAPLK